jgi:hypothetical protein
MISYLIFTCHAMWLHPDSITAGGFRFLDNGPTGFHYLTYGPMAFLEAGVLNALLFPIGVLFGFWNSRLNFESAFRINHVGFNDLTFSQLSVLTNIFLILISLYFLSLATKNLASIRCSYFLFAITIISLPIFLNQLTLNTIEPYVFFGISYALFASEKLYSNQNPLRFRDIASICAAYLLTLGVRPNLAILILPVFFYIALIRYKLIRSRTEIYAQVVALTSVAISYYPLISNSEELRSSVEKVLSLSGSSISSYDFLRNSQVLILNLGVIVMISLLIFIADFTMQMRHSATSTMFRITWFIPVMLQIILYLSNKNGFPKYIVPIVPILLFNCVSVALVVLMYLSKKSSNYNSLKFVASSIVVVLFVSLGLANYQKYQDRSKFDTREILVNMIPNDTIWINKLSSQISVTAILTRGPFGIPFDLMPRHLTEVNHSILDCGEILIMSSQEFNASQTLKQVQKCSRQGKYMVMEINPYKTQGDFEEKLEWVGLLSFGTPMDEFRLGFGPLYTLMIREDSSYRDHFKEACRSVSACKTVSRI